MSGQTKENEAVLRLTRTFQAPRERVYRAWTEARQLERWFAPSDRFETRIVELDLQPGGRYRFEMKSESGEFHRLSGEFHVVEPPRKLVYTWRWHDWEGSQPDSLVTVEFRDLGDATEVALTHERLPDAASRERHGEGWSGCLGRLERLVESAGMESGGTPGPRR